MKILYLHQYFNTPRMSGGTRSYEMGRHFAAAGHEVHVITSDRTLAPGARGWRETDEAGMRVHWLPVPYANAMGNERRLRAFAEFAWGAACRAVKVGGDVVLATSTPLTIALPGAWASSRLKVPMVFEVRDLWPAVPVAVGALRSPLTMAAARRLERFAYARAARVVALSPGMKEGVVATGYLAERVEVIPNGCDLELFAVPPQRGQEFRARHAWLGDRPLVLYAGVLGMVNGVDWLVRVAACARQLDPEVRFLVVGAGREEARVRADAAAAGLLNESFFMLPPVPKVEVPSLLSAADVALSLVIDVPIMGANSANKVFDALASSRPIAINYLGWQADLINETGCGLVLPHGDASLAARRLIEAVRSREWLVVAGAVAGRLARERFARGLLADRMLNVLEETSDLCFSAR